MSDMPLVSIIVPVYNVEQYLPQCLDSLINQTYSNLEIICVNDESPDYSELILKKYAKNDSRIIIINQKNTGLSGARNTGMKYATGQFVMFVDSDDWIDIDTCENALRTALEKDADLVMWSYTREYEDHSADKLMYWKHEQVFDKDDVKYQINRRLCGLYAEELAHPDYANAVETAWGKLYRFSILKENKIKFVSEREIGTEDALFNLYATKHVKKAVYLRKCYNHYRKSNVGSLTSSYKEKLFSQWQHLFYLIEEFIKRNNLDESFYVALNNRIVLSILGLGLNILGSNVSASRKRKFLKDIITTKRYQNACKTLTFKYFPIHWKLFYFCAKQRFVTPLYYLLMIIHKLIA